MWPRIAIAATLFIMMAACTDLECGEGTHQESGVCGRRPSGDAGSKRKADQHPLALFVGKGVLKRARVQAAGEAKATTVRALTSSLPAAAPS